MPPKKRVKPVKAENLASSAESENDENAEPTLVAKNGATAILPAPRLGRACKRTVTKRKSLEHISDQQEQTSSVATAKASEKASKKATAIKAEAVPQVIKKKFTSVSASNILDKAVTSIKQSKIPVIDINSSSSDDDDIDSADDFTVLPKTSTRVTVKRVVSSAKLVKQSSSSSVLKSITNQNDLKTQNVAANNQAESITGSRGPGRKTKKSSVNATKKNGASATVSTSNSQESVRMATQESVPLSDEEDEPMGKIPRVFVVVVVVQRLYVSYC